MPKAASDSKKASSAKGKKDTKKDKRAPTAYNLFVKANLQPWRAANAGKTPGEAMAHMAALWREHPDNPNRGKEPKARKPKAGAKKTKRGKENDAPADIGSDETIPNSDD
ncbi:hypothetical protein HGRIS_004375 [Hohenbuehelia grisea]|uniref:HMG box domain-containing protein n=1 Tax=Hohenbuehelia grisea TaxID=104357 RepID=A0ABR3JBM5_9AGAR